MAAQHVTVLNDTIIDDSNQEPNSRVIKTTQTGGSVECMAAHGGTSRVK
jgi:hypothetical protein